MNLRGILLGTAVAVMLPTAAMAAPEGFYVGAGAGVNWTQDADIVREGTPAELEASFKLGYVGSVSAGYATAAGPRAELEFAWRWNNPVDSTESALPALTGISTGKASSWAVMGNLLYDINTGTGFTPYIGVGAGIAQVRMDLGGFDDRDYVFAYQGIAGVAYNITNNLALTLDYRYFATLDPKFDLGGPGALAGSTVEAEYRNHTVMAGLRYSFGAPAAAPAAAPVAPPAAVQQQPQTEYLVFFDWDKAEITPVSDKIIGDAAAAAGRVRAVSIHVIGHTDTSGSPAYNQKLSVRRAEAVRRALVAKGVPANQVSIEGKGETQLLVPTGPNVREPSNRRAQILIRVQ